MEDARKENNWKNFLSDKMAEDTHIRGVINNHKSKETPLISRRKRIKWSWSGSILT